jgi:hypothetical protein
VWQAPADAVRRRTDAGLMVDSIIQIECTLRDGRGEVAADERIVTVEADGGDLLGLENGDLSDNTPYAAPRRHTLDGRVIVFVNPGERTTVRLSAPGLPAVRVGCGS